MKRYLLLLPALICSFFLSAQPGFMGTALTDGSYIEPALNDLGAFRQVQLLALTSGVARQWNFIQNSGDYSTNWRPYTVGQTLVGYNTIIDPVSQTASARYNSSTGGQPGLLPSVQAGNYYTVNITEFATTAGPGIPGQYMAILEANWCNSCRPINSVSGTGCISECGYEVTVSMASPPAANEYVYVRYSTDGFATSSLAAFSFSGTTGTATIPGQGAGVGVTYYVYSSNRTLAQIQSEVSTYGQFAHDMMTVNLNNNGGSNYAASACIPYSDPIAVCQSTIVSLDASGNAVLLAADIDGGSTDYCSAVTLTASPNSFTCADIGANPVTLTVTDGNSNTAACTASVDVQDNMAPTGVTCQNVTVSLDASGVFNLSVGFVTSNILTSFTDNCKPFPTTIGVGSPSLVQYTCANFGTFPATFSFKDGNGNETPCTINMTVADPLNVCCVPTAVCQSLTVALDGSGNYSLVASEVDNGSSSACGISSLSVSPNSFTCADVGANPVTLTVTDGNSNTAACTASITVSDPLNACCSAITPTLTFSSTFSNTTICSGNTPYFSPDGVIAPTGNTQAIKVDITAPGVSASSSYITTVPRSLEINSLNGAGTATYVVTAYSFGLNGSNENGGGDDCLGQTETYVVTVNALPTATISGGGTVCPGSNAPNLLFNFTGKNPWTFSVFNGTTSTTYGPANSNPFQIGNPLDGSYTVTSITDDNNCTNNVNSNTVVVARVDNTPPTATCSPHTVALDAVGNYSLVASDENAIGSGSTDNCGSVSLAVSPNTFDCADIGPNTVTLTVTDGSSNTAACTASVTVEDKQAPIVGCLLDYGNGSDGAFHATSNMTLPGGVYNYTSFTIDAGVTVQAAGGDSLVIKCTGPVTINGTLSVDGDAGNPGQTFVTFGTGGIGHAGGYNGGNGVFHPSTGQIPGNPGMGPGGGQGGLSWGGGSGAGHATTGVSATGGNGGAAYGTATLSPPLGGSGGGGGSGGNNCGSGGGGAGGGIIAIRTSSTLTLGLSGAITSNGGDGGSDGTGNCGAGGGGSGGSIWIQVGSLVNNGIISAQGGTGGSSTAGAQFNSTGGAGADGRIRLGYQTIAGNGTVNPSAGSTVVCLAGCMNATLNLDPSGNATLASSAVNGGGWTDNCGISSYDVSPNTFSCGDLGSQTVTLTAQDQAGNTAACTANVLVQDLILPSIQFLDCEQSNAEGTAYADGWHSGDNDGSGFGPWALTLSNPGNGSQNGHFRGDSRLNGGSGGLNDPNGDGDINSGGFALGLYANSAQGADAVRPILGTFTLLSTLTVDFDNGNIDPGQIQGFQIQNSSGSSLGEVRLRGGQSTYELVDANGITPFNLIGFTDQGLTIRVQSLNATQAEFRLTRRIDGVSQTLVSDLFPGGGNQVIGRFKVFNSNAGSGSTNDLYINNMEVCLATPGCPPNMTVNNDPGQCQAVVRYPFLVASDNCSAIITPVSGLPTGAIFPVGTTVNAFSVTDAAGNTASCSFDLEVVDNEPITAICQDVTVELDGNGNATIAVSDVDNGSTDNCGISTITLAPNSFDCADVAGNPNVVTLTVTNNNSVQSTCTANVTVEDNEAPVLICQNITVNLDANGEGTASVFTTGALVSQSDNCSTVGGVGVTGPNLLRCAQLGTFSRNIIQDDPSGNKGSCSFLTTVIDALPPTANCQDATVSINAGSTATVAPSDIDNSSSDNCGIASLSTSPSTFGCSDLGNHTITLGLADGSGNTSSCTATVMIVDNTAPTAVCQSATITLDAGGNASLALSDIDGGSFTGCSLPTLSASQSTFDCSHVGANTVTLTASNGGNSGSCTANVWVQDNAPVALCKNAVAVLGVGSVTIPASLVDNGSSDDCGAVSLSVSPNNFTCGQEGQNQTVTLTITDNNNNVSTCTATVNVDDQTLPTAICKNITVQLDANGQKTIAMGDVNNGSTDNCGFTNPLSVTPNSFTCSDIGNNTVTLIVGDGNGNQNSCTATVTVEETAPTASCKNVTVNLDNSGMASIVGSDVDAGSTDDCGIASMSVSPSTFDCNSLGANTVTLTVTDPSGNTASCTATVTIDDPLSACCAGPVAVCQDVTVSLDANGQANVPAAMVDNSSSADCGLQSLSVSPDLFLCGNVGLQQTVTLTVTDINSSTDQCTAHVTVEDNRPPTFFTRACSTSNATGTDYADGWDSGDNDGNGFSAWGIVMSPTDAGTFLGDSRLNGTPGGSINDPNLDGDINTNGFALGMYANSGSAVDAKRTLQNNLPVEGKFSIAFDNGNIDPNESVSVVCLTSTAQRLFSVSFVGGQTYYQLDDNNGTAYFTSVGFTDQGLLIEVEILSRFHANVTLTRLTDGVSQSLIANYETPNKLLGQVRILNQDAGNGSSNDLFINSLAACYPVSGCPGNVSVNTDPGQCGTTVAYEEILASDNCPGSLTVMQTSGQASGTFFPIGTTTNTFSVTDANGNTASCSFDVTVNENEPPTISCQDVTVSLDANGQVSVPVSNTPIANSVTDFNGTQGTNGWEYGMHSAFDYAGFTRLPNFTGFVWNNPGTTLDFPQIDAQGGHPDLDNLQWAVRRWTSNITGSIRITGDFFDRDGNCGDGAHVRIFKNGTEMYQYLNVPTSYESYDLTIPVNAGDHIDFVIDPKFNASCDDTHFTAQISELGNTSSYDDNCGVASVSASRSTFSCTDIGSHTVTMTVTDVNNNTATCTSEVTVVDALAPVAKCQDVTVQLDANGQYQFAASEADNGSSDNCQLASVVVNGFPSITLSCLHANGPSSVSLRATDASGNFSDCQLTITTQDVTPPTAICQPATVVLSAIDGTGSITASDVDGGSSDACTISSLSVSPSTFDCSTVGANTVVLTVTDVNNNTANCTATVTVDDSQSKPATLAQQNCGNCGEIRLFYCQFDPNPASLKDFIDGTVETNANYVAGNSLHWYDDNNGSLGGAHAGTGQEPAVPNLSTGNANYFYWVAQIDQNTGCFSDPIQVRIRVRKTPTPVFNSPPTPFCEGGQLNLAALVDDPNNVADRFDFYDGDPNNGGSLIGSATATNGSVNNGQVVVATPVVGSNTYWVVATNTGGNNSISCPATSSMSFVVSPTPLIAPISNITVCPGDPVNVNILATPSSGAAYVWTNSNTAIGLGPFSYSFSNNISFTAAANSSGTPLVGTIAVRVLVNGCASGIETFDVSINSHAVVNPVGSGAVCSGQATGLVLSTVVGSPQVTSYRLVSVNLAPGLTANGGNQSPGSGLSANALANDVFTNTTSAPLTATYRLRTVTAANCTSAVQLVTATILPEPVILSGQKDTVCSGQPANLALQTANSLLGTVFSWTPQNLPAGISLVSSSSPGAVITDVLVNNTASAVDVIYDVTATAGNCGSVVVPCNIRVVPFPLVPPTATLSACEELLTPGQATFDLTSLDAGIGSGLPVNYFSDPNLLNPIPTPAAYVSGSTTVYASVVSPNNTCPNRTDVSLNLVSLALPQVSSSTFPCSNTSQEIIPTPVVGISFHFYDGDPDQGGLLLGSGSSYDPMLTTGQSQTIWVTATDGSCESDAVATTVTVNPAPTASISSNLNNGGICIGDTLELYGAGNGSFSWRGPNGFTSSLQNPRIEGFSALDSGNFILTVTNAFSCSTEDTLYIVGNRAKNPGQNGTLTIAANAPAVDLFNYLLGTPEQGGVWAGPSAPYNGYHGTFNPNFMLPGLYTYTLTNPAACIDSISFATVLVNVTPVTAAKVRARVYLEGVLDTTNLRMIDSLRSRAFLPTAEPYSALGYAHVNGGGSESFPHAQLALTGPNALVDWVYLELRSSSDPTHIVATRSALLQRDGDIVDLDGASPVCFNRVSPGFYYVVVGHRNHVPVMTGIAVFINSTGSVNLDFTTSSLPIYGTNPMNVTAKSIVAGGVRVLIGGDADFNGQIQNTDDVLYWIPFVGGSGYRRADYNCDGEVQNNDRVYLWAPNVGKGTAVPARSN